MPTIDENELAFRKGLALDILTWRAYEPETEAAPMLAPGIVAEKPTYDYPADTAPKPYALDPAPSPDDAFPRADVIVVTWTRDEWEALADVLTPGVSVAKYYTYRRDFDSYLPQIRIGAPARMLNRLGAYYMTKIGDKNVLCLKCDLHLNQDSIRSKDKPGTATLPVKQFFNQMIDETNAGVVITTGTAGAVYTKQDLGDVVVTRAGRFYLHDEFKNEPFNDKTYKSDWTIPKKYFDDAKKFMNKYASNLTSGPILPPTVNYKPNDEKECPTPISNPDPNIWLDGEGEMPPFHPILTTDFFEFGTSTNGLEKIGAACEMGDAVLGLAIDERAAAGKSAPKWVIVRNCSDPQINGNLVGKPSKISQQAMWAVFFYKGYGYWTTVMSAIACWAIVAGL
jgi:hypothetical protein